MNEGYEVLQSFVKDGIERSPQVIGVFRYKDDAFNWVKFRQKYRNKNNYFRLYLRTLTATYPVNELPEHYKDFEN